MCHGHIAKNAKPIIAIFLFAIFFNNIYKITNDIQPKIAIGSLIDNVFNPNTAINGIIR